MPKDKTNAERQREFRQRKADTEATEVRGIFAHPDDHAEVKEAAAKIAVYVAEDIALDATRIAVIKLEDGWHKVGVSALKELGT